MSMITGARAWIELPTPEPLGGGVVSVARVIDTTGHVLMGVEGQTDACATVEDWDEWCTTAPVGRKLFDGPWEYVSGDPFAVYAGVSCDLQKLDEAESRARARLDLGESRGVDYHVDALLAADPDVVNLGGPFRLSEAIGVAEAFAATVYGGKPTLLIPRVVLPCDPTQFESSPGGTLTTKAGSLVGPLTTAITVPYVAEPHTMYVTGSITLLRGPVNSYSVPQQVSDLGPGFAPMRALAERVYVPVFDCLVAKVEVTCS